MQENRILDEIIYVPSFGKASMESMRALPRTTLRFAVADLFLAVKAIPTSPRWREHLTPTQRWDAATHLVLHLSHQSLCLEFELHENKAFLVRANNLCLDTGPS